MVHRGAGAAGKRWDPAGFEAVAAWWRGRGGTVLDLRGPSDDALAPLPGSRVVAPALADLARVLAGATAFVGNDSGPAHVAGAVGTPAVVVYGPTRAARWRPLAARAIAVQAAADGARGFGRVDPGIVVHALASLVARVRADGRS